MGWYRDGREPGGLLGASCRLIDRLAGGVNAAACAMCLALTLLTVGLVVLGWFTSAGNSAMQDLKWWTFGLIIMAGGAACLRDDGHVRVDLVYGRLPLRGRAIIDCIGMLLAVLPLCVVVSWFGFSIALDGWQRGESSLNAGGMPWQWLMRFSIPLGFILLAIQALAQATRSLVLVINPRDESAS